MGVQEQEVDCIVMQPPALGGNDIRHQRRGERSRVGGGGERSRVVAAPCAATKELAAHLSSL